MICGACKWKGNERVCKACSEIDVDSALPPAHVERPVSDEPVGKEEGPRRDSRCNLHIHSRTNRLSDPDGRSVKALIDGIVEAGILKGDSAKFINQVTQSQTKVKGDEETIVTIEWDVSEAAALAEVHDLATRIL